MTHPAPTDPMEHIRQLESEIERLNARVEDLLAYSNRVLQRARDVEARADALMKAVLAGADLGGTLARELREAKR